MKAYIQKNNGHLGWSSEENLIISVEKSEEFAFRVSLESKSRFKTKIDFPFLAGSCFYHTKKMAHKIPQKLLKRVEAAKEPQLKS